MKKRFIDCDKWDDPWFRKLPADYKTLWDFILCKCDNAGVWKVDFELARFLTNAMTIDNETALNLFNESKERVREFKKGYWFIVDFVHFQFGGFGGDNNFHKQIRKLLEKYGLDDFQPQASPCLDPMDKDKEKDKEEDKEKDLLRKKSEKTPFGELGTVKLTENEYSKLVQRYGQAETEAKISRLENYILSKGVRYKSHYHTILTWADRGGVNSGDKKIRGRADMLETARKIKEELMS